MTSNSIHQIQCPACGELNDAGSRFCRHCGAALETKPGESHAPAPAVEAAAKTKTENPGGKAESKIEAHAPIIAPLPVAPTPQHDVSYDAGDEERSSPAEIDARRARQLLDRSLYLSERGDAAGAILACRQSVALAPTAPGGYSMLGLLLERTGDLPRAITAYEKAVQLAPSSTMEKESLDRLREKVGAQKAPSLFHFDEAELFGDGKDGAKKAAATVVPVVVAAETAAVAAEEAPLPNIGASAPGLPSARIPAAPITEAKTAPRAPHPAAGTPAAFDVAPGLAASLSAQLNAITPPMATAMAIEERRAADRRRTSIPVMTERRFSTERRTPTATRTAATTGAAPIYIAGLNNGAKKSTGSWDALWQHPSFYGRALPLMGTTVLCVGFLLWAHGWAVARAAANTNLAAVPTTEVVTPTDPGVPVQQGLTNNPSNLAPAPPLTGGINGGFPISNGSTPNTSTAVNNGGGTRPATSGGGGGNSSRLVSVPKGQPSFPNIIAPAAIPSNSGGAAGSGSAPGGRGAGATSGGGGAGIGLPSPNIPRPVAADPPVEVVPIGGASSGPLNPAGASGRGYVRITQGHIGTSALPSRPAAQAGNDERDAANASRAGQPDRAISSLSNAINSDSSDAGFRFQQRATLFLERGDYARAAQDFQSAISAYNDQILRGEQVAAAQAGVRAARSGLNLALAGHQ